MSAAPDSAAAPERNVLTPLINAALVAAIILLAGLTPVAAKFAMNALPPFSTGCVRFLTAGLLLLVAQRFLPNRAPQGRAPIARADYARFLIAALLCVPINQFCFLLGVSWANASHTGLFYALNPVLTYLITLALGSATLTTRMSSATLLAFVGAAALSIEGISISQQFLWGDVLLFFAVFSFAGYSVSVVPLASRYGAFRSAALVMTLGGLLYTPTLLVDGAALLAVTSPAAWIGLAYITLGTSFVNYALWFVALTRLDVNRVSVSVNAAPLVTVVAAYLLLHEPLSKLLVLAGALLLAGITLANWRRKRTQ